MKPEQFENRSAGRLVRVGRGEAAYWAFVPHPLPPALEQDERVAQNLARATKALGDLAALANSIPNLSVFAVPLLRADAIASSKIEGIEVDLRDLYAYDAGLLPLPSFLNVGPEDDLRRVLNYVAAIDYALERVEELPLSLRLLREIHEVLMDGEQYERTTPGEFRASQNWVGDPGVLLADARYVPPPPHEMHEALDAFEKYLHAEDANPLLIRLALIHYQLEAIHPFLMGNGRVGRILLSLLTTYWGLLPLPVLSLSGYFNLYRQRHQEYMLEVSERGAWNQWIAFFLEAVTWQARDAIDRIGDLRGLYAELLAQVEKLDTGVAPDEVVDLLFRYPVLTAQEANIGLAASSEVAERLLRQLATANIVEEIGGRARPGLFMAVALLQILGW